MDLIAIFMMLCWKTEAKASHVNDKMFIIHAETRKSTLVLYECLELVSPNILGKRRFDSILLGSLADTHVCVLKLYVFNVTREKSILNED